MADGRWYVKAVSDQAPKARNSARKKSSYEAPKVVSHSVFEASALVSCGKTTAEANNPFHPLSGVCSSNLSAS